MHTCGVETHTVVCYGALSMPRQKVCVMVLLYCTVSTVHKMFEVPTEHYMAPKFCAPAKEIMTET